VERATEIDARQGPGSSSWKRATEIDARQGPGSSSWKRNTEAAIDARQSYGPGTGTWCKRDTEAAIEARQGEYTPPPCLPRM
jgi:hypothetical protein